MNSCRFLVGDFLGSLRFYNPTNYTDIAISTFFPEKAIPYFTISVIPLDFNSVSYRFSSICFSAFSAADIRLLSTFSALNSKIIPGREGNFGSNTRSNLPSPASLFDRIKYLDDIPAASPSIIP